MKNKIDANSTNNELMADALKSLRSVRMVKRKSKRDKCDSLIGAHTTNICSDIIFSILSRFPTETILALKTVCRDWAQIISDPVFIRAHCFQPGPITSFFTHCKKSRCQASKRPDHFFTPLPPSPKTPRMITLLLSNGFKVTSTSHGLVCFCREKDGVIILANPATSHWSLIPLSWSVNPFPCPSTVDGEYQAAPLIIYDPKSSLHFKLVIPTCDTNGCSLRFHVYSSETGSWIISSLCPHNRKMQCFRMQSELEGGFNESKLGGGSVCWWGGEYNILCGYEINSDTYWTTLLPWGEKGTIEEQCHVLARDGEIYCVVFYHKTMTVEVRRLDGNKQWVLEGEGDIHELEKFPPTFNFPHLSYDNVKKALIMTVLGEGLHAFYLSSSRIEMICQEDYSDFGQVKLAHTNTLASFHGGKQGNW